MYPLSSTSGSRISFTSRALAFARALALSFSNDASQGSRETQH